MLRISLLSVLLFSSVWAHKINLFAYDEAGQLYVQSYFTQSSPCKQCVVKLLDANQKELLVFNTDDEGKASVKLPSAEFTIIVEAGMGHQTQTNYVAQSHTKEEAKTLPSDTPWDKMLLGLAIIVFFFGALYWTKRKPSHA
ncbi:MULTISPECIES: hypothetical protein [unclassified Sulfurospirillum]|uniref:hypothetical protein n=1 Tax=unclassified Sulfurospirillum TaxID=2618290 RepID=UPI0006908D62|nr:MULTISPECIES: hypothetical protein [unclassified Sulfurospirillum]